MRLSMLAGGGEAGHTAYLTFAMHLPVSNADCSIWHKPGVVLQQCLRGRQRRGRQQDAPQQSGVQGLKVWLLPEGCRALE